MIPQPYNLAEGSAQASPLLRIDRLRVAFPAPNHADVYAVDGVSLDLFAGQSLGVIGESGSGKSTLGYAMLNLIPSPGYVAGGRMVLSGVGELQDLSESNWSRIRGSKLSMVFQAAQSRFNPLMRLEQQLRDAFAAQRVPIAAGMQRARALMAEGQLDPDRVMRAYPHELSGGMRQRVSLVFALATQPQLLILDEPTTALDVITQRIVLKQLQTLIESLGVTIVLITHDYSVVSALCQRVAVMYAGELVEVASVGDLYRQPSHPYSYGLVRSVPSVRGDILDLKGIPGGPPDLRNVPQGCRFAPRCPLATEHCRQEHPDLKRLESGRQVRCWRTDEIETSHDLLYQAWVASDHQE